MINLSIDTTPFFFLVYNDSTKSGYYFERSSNITQEEVFQNFRNLALESWMNPQTLEVLKAEVIKAYPELNIDWVNIMGYVTNAFKNREISSVHLEYEFKGDYDVFPGVNIA